MLDFPFVGERRGRIFASTVPVCPEGLGAIDSLAWRASDRGL